MSPESSSSAERRLRIASTDDIPPGKMRCFEVAGRRVLIANVDGQFLAADDLCTHEDASLSTGSLKGRYVKCPLHGSRFDLESGAAMEDPAVDPLRTYAVQVEGGEIFIAADHQDTDY